VLRALASLAAFRIGDRMLVRVPIIRLSIEKTRDTTAEAVEVAWHVQCNETDLDDQHWSKRRRTGQNDIQVL
jgi:hypothetical protein